MSSEDHKSIKKVLSTYQNYIIPLHAQIFKQKWLSCPMLDTPLPFFKKKYLVLFQYLFCFHFSDVKIKNILPLIQWFFEHCYCPWIHVLGVLKHSLFLSHFMMIHSSEILGMIKESLNIQCWSLCPYVIIRVCSSYVSNGSTFHHQTGPAKEIIKLLFPILSAIGLKKSSPREISPERHFFTLLLLN